MQSTGVHDEINLNDLTNDNFAKNLEKYRMIKELVEIRRTRNDDINEISDDMTSTPSPAKSRRRTLRKPHRKQRAPQLLEEVSPR